MNRARRRGLSRLPPALSADAPFPERFLWGAATSAHQIEGHPHADGGGLSIWDRFAATPGRTHRGEHARIACDHYHRWKDDVALMQRIGLQAYRFSVAWARVLPEGTGRPNPAGLSFYSRLVDALLEAGIQPYLTLYHWDLPAALDDRGGWLNSDIAGWMADYAALMHRTLGDRVAAWATLNEPWVSMDAGYLEGVHAPGHRNVYEAPLAAHNLLRAHGASVQALRAEGASNVGLVVNLEPKYAASEAPEDLAATARMEAYMNHFFLDPVLRGAYPERLAEVFGQAWPSFSAEDLALIGQPLDFLGVNYYKRAVVRAAPEVPLFRAAPVAQPQHDHTQLDWEVFPDGLREMLVRIRDRYPNLPPVYITENGAAYHDPPTALADPHPDPLRVAYFRGHLAAVRAAIEQGVDVRGYFAWSLLDNYEWSAGYAMRFGLTHVDFATQQRTLKTSAHLYRDVIASNGAVLEAG